MNPKLLALCLIAVLLLLGYLVWLNHRDRDPAAQARPRRRQRRRTERELELAIVALQEIDLQVDLYRDIDVPLAAAVRPIINRFNTQRLELYR